VIVMGGGGSNEDLGYIFGKFLVSWKLQDGFIIFKTILNKSDQLLLNVECNKCDLCWKANINETIS